MSVTRAQVVAKAREFEHTPFHDKARVLGRGVDCVGLVLAVAEDLGLCDRHGRVFKREDYPTYPKAPTDGRVLEECRHRLKEKAIATIAAGDVVCMRIPLDPCHTGIVTERGAKLYLIHAYNGGNKEVIEHILDKSWRRRIVAAFSIPGVVW